MKNTLQYMQNAVGQVKSIEVIIHICIYELIEIIIIIIIVLYNMYIYIRAGVEPTTYSLY